MQSLDFKFVAWWAGATAGGLLFGFLVSTTSGPWLTILFGTIFFLSGLWVVQRSIILGCLSSMALTLGFSFFLIFSPVGVFQYFLLRHKFHLSVFWIPATMLGGWVGWSLGKLLEYFLGIVGILPDVEESLALVSISFSGPVAGLFAGLILGILQALLLRESGKEARWWIFASCVAWGLAGGIGLILVDVIPTFVLISIQTIVVSGITGMTMSWLVNVLPNGTFIESSTA